jgi:outer membrane lipoprotein-sorting protein
LVVDVERNPEAPAMSYLLRRLPLSRLLLLCGVLVAVGIGATALASALSVGPTPPPKPLADAVHDALTAQPVEGVSAQIQLTNHLLEGASLASGGSEASQLTSSPLLSGASGRLWISKAGHVRLELQSEKGDTQVYFDGHTLSMYDASSNTLYHYTPPAQEGDWSNDNQKMSAEPDRNAPGHSADVPGEPNEAPSVAKIEEAIARLSRHTDVSGATPTDVAGQAAYTVRVSPKEGGSLLAGAELSWDAIHGVPLRAAIYSTESSAPVLELAATSISYGPVEPSVFEFTPPANAKVEEVVLPKPGERQGSSQGGEQEHPNVTTHGSGPGTVAVLEGKVKAGGSQSSPLPEGLQQVKINGITASELPTELGTLLTFERSGVRYLVAGAVTPAAVEAVAKGL